MSRGERATLETVAAAAGVSKATASKVLNGRSGVSAATRTHVLDVMRRLEYAPSTGRAVGGRKPTVTVMFDGTQSLYSGTVLSGIVAGGFDLGVDAVVRMPAGGHPHEPLSAEWLREVADRGHIGVIAVTTEVKPDAARAAAEVGLALVLVDPVSARDADADGPFSVSATNWSGGYQATAHLLELGHRRIGFAGGRAESQPARQRFHGHVAALGAAGVQVDSRLILRLGFGYEVGRMMGEELLALAEPPTGIVAGSDASALGVMAAARQRELRLPQDLSIVGFDDTYAAEYASPRLTTVRQPLREMGRLAIRTALSIAHGKAPETHHFELATTLVVRESTAPPNRELVDGS